MKGGLQTGSFCKICRRGHGLKLFADALGTKVVEKALQQAEEFQLLKVATGGKRDPEEKDAQLKRILIKIAANKRAAFDEIEVMEDQEARGLEPEKAVKRTGTMREHRNNAGTRPTSPPKIEKEHEVHEKTLGSLGGGKQDDTTQEEEEHTVEVWFAPGSNSFAQFSRASCRAFPV